MKKYLMLLLGMFAATVAVADEGRAFSLATAGDVDAAFAERVRAHMEKFAGAAVALAPAVPLEAGQTLEAIGLAAAKTLEKGHPGIIVLARPTDEQPQGVCLPWEHFAVLNVAKLEADADAAKVERRAGQEGLRVMAMLLDMSQCPFPLCVLTGYEKTADLDQMSGNFCPPCLDRFTRVARDAGLRLIEETEPEAEPIPAAEASPEAVPAVE